MCVCVCVCVCLCVCMYSVIASVKCIITCILSQVNLQQRMRITGVITQGARRLGRSEFVKTYRVAYGDDGKTWRMIKAKGSKEDLVNLFLDT